MCRYGKGSTVVGIEITGAYGEKIQVPVGDYIAVDPANPGFFIKYDAEQFEKYFERIPDNGSQNL
jgi:hypothetical protein